MLINNNLNEVTSYKYLGMYIHHKLKWNYSIEKMIHEGWKDYFGTLGCGIKRKSSLRLLSLMLSYMVVKFGASTSVDNHEE